MKNKKDQADSPDYYSEDTFLESMFSLKGRTALITGASRGIGKAIAVMLAQHGAFCILVSRKIQDLQAVVDRITVTGGRAKPAACNMGDMAQISDLVRKINSEHDGLDILVNNAATNPYFGPMGGISPAQWDKTIDVNLKGPFFLIQKTIPLLKASGRASVINVSSVNGLRPSPMQGAYSMTKSALISMTQGFAKELASGNIRVNALLPGLTETKFSKALTEDEHLLKQVCSTIPLKRQGQPVEMAGAALYLASDASSYTTGSCIVCDGGLLA